MLLKQLGKNVFYYPFGKNDRPNLGLIVGEKSCLAVDAGNSENHAKQFLLEAEALRQKPEYLVLTHSHWDHVFGAYYLNAKTICHVEAAENIKNMSVLNYNDASLDLRVKQGTESIFVRDNMKKEFPTREYFSFPHIDLTFDDSVTIHLGGVDCYVKHIHTVHQKGSCTVYIPQNNIIFLGDSIWMNMTASEWCYSISELYILSSTLKFYNADYYIDSHLDPIPKKVMFSWLDQLLSAADLAKRMKGDKALLLKELERNGAFGNANIIPLELISDALACGARTE